MQTPTVVVCHGPACDSDDDDDDDTTTASTSTAADRIDDTQVDSAQEDEVRENEGVEDEGGEEGQEEQGPEVTPDNSDGNRGGSRNGGEENGDDDEVETDNVDRFPMEEGADLDGYTTTPADDLLISIYGDHAHDNNGDHLDGGIGVGEDAKWIRFWRRIVQIKPIWYKVPQGRIGKLFIRNIAAIFRGIRNREWNSERLIVYPAVILYKAAGITASKDIRAKIESRMKLWNEGRFNALLEDVEVEARLRRGPRREKTTEEVDRDFNARVLSGHLRSPVRGITQRDGGNVISADGTCSKSGLPVLEVLRAKHPAPREPTSIGIEGGTFETYDSIPVTIPLVISSDTVEEISAKLTGSAGPGGPDSLTLKTWCLGFGQTSGELRAEIANFATWMANTNPSWAAYRALMACRLVALDKEPGTRPLGIGETYR